MGKGKIAATVICAVTIPAAVLVGAYFLLGNGLFSDGKEYFRFAESAEATEDETVYVEAGELADYHTKYPDAVSEYYRNQLSENELYIYNAVSYAVDNGYTNVFFPAEYCDDGSEIPYIITLYSSDSPFLEHNYTESGKFTLSFITPTSGKGAGQKMCLFELPRNAAEYTAKKKAAYATAKQIVDEMPSEFKTDIEKAAYLYDYAAQNITYDQSDFTYDTVPIYDALGEKHTTICGGFADTITLLFNLADIDAFSVEGTSDRNVGHVINAAEIDGQYYYFDASADSAACANGFKGRFYYCMSKSTANGYFEENQKLIPLLPDCGKDGYEYSVDFTADNADDDAANTAAELLSGGEPILVRFSESISDSDVNQFAKKLVELTGKQVTYSTYNGLTGFLAE